MGTMLREETAPTMPHIRPTPNQGNGGMLWKPARNIPPISLKKRLSISQKFKYEI
jgi:hypothetical protein